MIFTPQEQLLAELTTVLTGAADGTQAQAAECNPTFGDLHAELPGWVALLPAGEYVVVDLEAGPPEEYGALFDVGTGVYPPNVYMDWAQSQDVGPAAEQVVYGSMQADYSMVQLIHTPYGPGLTLGLAGSPLNSAVDCWVLPAACWPTPELLASLKAEYLAATADSRAAVDKWVADNAG